MPHARDRQLSRDFWLREITAKSRVAVTESDVDVYRDLVVRVLQPVRRAVEDELIRRGITPRPGWGIVITSGKREEGAHLQGAIDFVVMDPAVPVQSNEWSEWAFEWLARYKGPDDYGQIIWERDHVHVTRPGVIIKGIPRYGQVYREPQEGIYVLARSPFDFETPSVIPAVPVGAEVSGPQRLGGMGFVMDPLDGFLALGALVLILALWP